MTAAEPRDRYQPETRLEAGLGGERWLATDRQTGKIVWLSVLDARAATEAHSKSFEAWARIAPTLSHPSLERMLDSGETALGNPYFAVESLETETLAARLDREPAISIHELVRVITAIVDGLLVAHRVGLVHGDIAPDRVHLLTGGRARLVGFGLNRAVARSLDATREASTVPYGDAYMSPEQAAGGAASISGDVWSVAGMLYRAVTGIPPRAQMDGRSTCQGIAEGPTRPVLELRPDLPNSFVQLLQKALADAPADRFKDAAELRKALTSALILAPAVARLPVIASPLPPETGEGIETSKPALPPPPKRTRLGIGPLGKARTVEPAPISALGALAPTPSAPVDDTRLSEAPSLVPRESDPPIEDAELLEDEDDDAVLTSAAPRSVHPPAPLAARGTASSARTSIPSKPTLRNAPAQPPPPVPSAASPSNRPPPLPPQSPHTDFVPSAPQASEAAPVELPMASGSAAAGLLAPPASRDSDPTPAPASSADDDFGLATSGGKGLPPKAWAAIVVLGVGLFVAVSGGVKLVSGMHESTRVDATPPRAPTHVDSHPADVTHETPPAVVAAVDAGPPAVAVAPIDAGAPPLPAIEPPTPEPTPVVHVPRTTGTTGRTHSTGSTNVSPMTTATPMTETPMTTPMTETPMTTTTPMTTAPMTEAPMHTLERDPGF